MRILISDTNWTTAALARDLRAAGFFVTEANDGEELIEFALNGMQDAILFDLDLPDMKGADVLRSLRAILPHTPICTTGAKVDGTLRVKLMDAGADDVFARDTDGALIAAHLRAFVRRTNGFATPLLRNGSLEIDLSAQSVSIQGTPLHLTRLEYELIEMLSLRSGILVTREMIMSQLYAWEDEPDPKIIDVYICRIRSKMAALGAADDLIHTSFALGYRIDLPAPAAMAA
ncbi:response regulator transcription factor [Litorivita sp. NS0012-18]|uniref:response regulator transcription factor n=1 Tax=Litorivita sp. NS0012-18 TaxID=3127655 RepID=UPI00310431E2